MSSLDGSDAEFSFVLTDGVHTTDTHAVPIATKPIYLSIQNNNVLNVFPLTRKPITSSMLLTTCSDETRNIKYVVRDGPRLGKIIMETEDGTWLEVNQFTQRDINESRVTYEHTKQFMDLTTNDSFVFDIEAHYTTSIVNQVKSNIVKKNKHLPTPLLHLTTNWFRCFVTRCSGNFFASLHFKCCTENNKP